MNERTEIHCREVRKNFLAITGRVPASSGYLRAAERHIETCEGCAREYRIFTLSRTVLDLAASPDPVRPDDAFFKGLRARIERGPESLGQRQGPAADESWSGALWLTARQLLPAMAMLLALIIGATLLWNRTSTNTNQMALRPGDRILFNDVYDYPAPTQDDVLESLVSVEEKENGQ
jgi:hypothetical protein